MTRRAVAVAASLLLIVSGAAVAFPVSAAGANIAVESVELSVDQPAPGEAFTLRTTIANLESSAGPVDVTDVYVRRDGSSNDLARVENAGTIDNGSSLTIPITATLDRIGEQRLTVHVVVEDQDGDYRRVEYPLYVDVREPDEAVLSFADVEPVAGQESSFNVTVGNGDSAALSNVRLDVGGDANVRNAERVSASLASGAQTTYTYRATFPTPGEQRVNATLTYQTSEGSTRTIDRSLPVDVERATVDPELRATVTDGNGSTAIRASLTQYGNVELRDVQVRAVADGETVARALLEDVPAESTRRVDLDASDIPAGEVTVVAAYTAADEPRRSSSRVTIVSDAELTAAATEANGSPAVRAALTQYGNVELRDVQFRAVVDGETVSRASAGTVPPGATRAVTLDGSDIPAGDVTVVAQYTSGGTERTSERTLRFSPRESSNVALTGIEVTRRGSTLTLSGDAANLGGADASSLLVSVAEAEGVTPVPPNREYFVGAVGTSEFATFELTANTSADVESVPIRISYAADGERFAQVVSVDVSQAADGGDDDASQGSGLPGGAVLGVVGVLVLAGVGALIYRRRT